VLPHLIRRAPVSSFSLFDNLFSSHLLPAPSFLRPEKVYSESLLSPLTPLFPFLVLFRLSLPFSFFFLRVQWPTGQGVTQMFFFPIFFVPQILHISPKPSFSFFPLPHSLFCSRFPFFSQQFRQNPLPLPHQVFSLSPCG